MPVQPSGDLKKNAGACIFCVDPHFSIMLEDPYGAGADRNGDLPMNFANHIGYSDVNPYEIVRRISDRTIEIRAMNAVRANPENKLGFIPGGFVGHCANQHEQEWTITSNPEARVKRIRLHKDGRWRCKSGERFVLAVQPRKFYDYNF